MYESSKGANRNAFKTATHRRNLVLIICQYPNVLITAPHQNFAIFMSRQNDMSRTCHRLIEHAKVVVFVVSNNTQAAYGRRGRIILRLRQRQVRLAKRFVTQREKSYLGER